MRTRILLVVTALSLSAAAYACGGVDPNSSLLGVGPDGGEEDDASSSRHDGGSIRDSGIHDGAANDGEVSSDGGGSHDGGIVIHPFGDGSVVPALCGDQPDGAVVICNPAAPTCCGDQLVSGTEFTCTAGSAACTGTDTIPVSCRDDRDCSGGQVCCGDLPPTGDGVYTSLKCTNSASCPVFDDAGVATEFVRYCTPDASDPCPSFGLTCMQGGIFSAFNRCY